MLAEEHPNLFAEAVRYEQEHSDGRTYTWTQGETLLELLERKDQIIAEHHKALEREKKQSNHQSLAQVLEKVFEDGDEMMPCLVCHL